MKNEGISFLLREEINERKRGRKTLKGTKMAPSTSPCSIINSTCTKSHTQIKSLNKSGDNSHHCVVAFFVACFMSVPTEPYQHIRKRAGFFWKRAINY